MISIREMIAADLDSMLDLRQGWLSRTIEEHAISQPVRDWFAAYPGNSRAFALVAIDKGKCLGYLLCSWHGNPTMSGTSAEIDEIHVAADYQRNGVGRKLVYRARESLLTRVSDLTTIRAFADRNDLRSRAFWKDIGYEQLVVEYVDYLE